MRCFQWVFPHVQRWFTDGAPAHVATAVARSFSLRRPREYGATWEHAAPDRDLARQGCFVFASPVAAVAPRDMRVLQSSLRTFRRGMAGGPDGRWRANHTKHVGGPHNIGHTPNMAIEKYAKYKEDYHLRFQWTPKRLRDLGIWVIGFPLFLHTIIKTEQVRIDPQNGRTDTKKDYL